MDRDWEDLRKIPLILWNPGHNQGEGATNQLDVLCKGDDVNTTASNLSARRLYMETVAE